MPETVFDRKKHNYSRDINFKYVFNSGGFRLRHPRFVPIVIIYKIYSKILNHNVSIMWYELVLISVATWSKAWIYGRSLAGIVGSNPTEGMDVFVEYCVLSGRGLCDALITRPEESYRLWYVAMCDLETSRMRRPWPALGRSATGRKNIYMYIRAHNQ